MFARRAIALGTLTIGALCAGAALVACIDLLHSTADVLTACELDAARPGCAAEAEASVETNFCAWNPVEAAKHAAHACTWLGACETPMGNNAFGPCYFRALLAYDCAANPNHQVQSGAHALWDCLQQVKSCADVDACVFHDEASPACPSGVNTACAGKGAALDVRVRCADDGAEPHPRAHGENCALWGQTCALSQGGSVCSGEASGGACDSGCAGRLLHWCTSADEGGPSGDVGIDCASNGAASCDGFPTRDAAHWVACKAESDAGDCAPSKSAMCDNGRATMCPSGVLETLDCASLLGTGSACVTGDLSPPFDWTSPCSVSPSECASDSCIAGRLTSCERGAAFTADCEGQGLGQCQLVTADPGSSPRAACGPPPP